MTTEYTPKNSMLWGSWGSGDYTINHTILGERLIELKTTGYFTDANGECVEVNIFSKNIKDEYSLYEYIRIRVKVENYDKYITLDIDSDSFKRVICIVIESLLDNNINELLVREIEKKVIEDINKIFIIANNCK